MQPIYLQFLGSTQMVTPLLVNIDSYELSIMKILKHAITYNVCFFGFKLMPAELSQKWLKNCYTM